MTTATTGTPTAAPSVRRSPHRLRRAGGMLLGAGLTILIVPTVGLAATGPDAGGTGASGPGTTLTIGHRPATSPATPGGGKDATPVFRTGYRWPLDGPPHLVRPFDPPPRPWLSGHRGVDLSAQVGVVVRAAGAGQVLFAGMVAGRPLVSVGHPGGLRTTYEPVTPVLPAGASVSAGQVIGSLAAGHPGCPTVACLHWGLRCGADYLDPLSLLGAGRVRLLPLTGSGPPPTGPGGRAAPVVVGRGGRTRRRGCRPGHTDAASPDPTMGSPPPRQPPRPRSGPAA